MATANRWLRPEVYPLFAAVGVALGICGMQLVRNIAINPEVRVIKEKRAAGVLENHAEGEKYAEHFVRRNGALNMGAGPTCLCLKLGKLASKVKP
ncbi:hypothetical protein Droror1_Dr00012329 [Drosera rotundifolia]